MHIMLLILVSFNRYLTKSLPCIIPEAGNTAVIKTMSLLSWCLYLVKGKGGGEKRRDKKEIYQTVLRAMKKSNKAGKKDESKAQEGEDGTSQNKDKKTSPIR